MKKSAFPILLITSIIFITVNIYSLQQNIFVDNLDNNANNLNQSKGNLTNIPQKLPDIYDAEGKLIAWNEDIYSLYYDNSNIIDNVLVEQDLDNLILKMPFLADQRDLYLSKMKFSKDTLRYKDILLSLNISLDAKRLFDQFKSEFISTGFYVQTTPSRKYLDQLEYLPIGIYNYLNGNQSGYESYLSKIPDVDNIQSVNTGISLQVSHDLATLINETNTSLGGNGGAISVIKIDDGSIVAMVTTPQLTHSDILDSTKYQAASKDNTLPLLNRNYQLAYPNGSTMKIVTGLAALESGKLLDSDIIYSEGILDLPGGVKFKEFTGLPYGNLTIYSAISKSSNIFFCKLFRDKGLTINELNKYQIMLGLGSKVIFDIDGETSGLIPSIDYKDKVSNEPWYLGDSCNSAIGQGYTLVTPVQIANVVAIYARGGVEIQPHITKSINYSQTSSTNKIEIKQNRLNIEEKNISIITNGMHELARNAGLPNWAIKTGTAEVPGGNPHAWITGYFPYGEPKYAVSIFVENGAASYKLYITLKEIEKLLSI